MRLGRIAALWGAAWLALGASAWAQGGITLALEAARLDVLAQGHGEAEFRGAMAREFASFLGPRAEEMLALLRRGRPVEMAPPPGPGESPPLRVAAPTQPMDWSDICLTLFLARARLARHGIARPSPRELRAALVGGKGPGAGREVWVGILAARGSGHTWEEIARGLRVEPAWLEGVLRAWNERLAAGASPGGGAEVREPEPVRITETGITTGRGKAIPAYTPPPGGEKGIGEGILSGSGNILGMPGHKPAQPEGKRPE
jgi:hypothetical protein